MNTRVFSLFVILLAAQLAPGQTVFSRIVFPGTVVQLMESQHNDHIWAIVSSGGNLALVEKKPGASEFKLVGTIPGSSALSISRTAGATITKDGKRHMKMPNLAVTDNKILIGTWEVDPGPPDINQRSSWWNIKVHEYDPSADVGTRLRCGDYRVDGMVAKPGELNLQGGPFPNYDGSHFMTGSFKYEQRLFTLVMGQSTTCELRTVVTSDSDIIWGAKIGDKIIARRLVDPYGFPLEITEVGVFEGGVFTSIVGPKESSPQVIAHLTFIANNVDMAFNQKKQEATISYSNASSDETVLIHYPSMRRILSKSGILTVRAGDYVGPFATFTENTLDSPSTQRVLLVNDTSGETHSIVDTNTEIYPGTKFPGIFPTSLALDASGSVFISPSSSSGQRYVYRATIPGISKPLSPPTVTLRVNKATVEENEFVTLSWESTDAHEVNISCFGQVSASGSREVSVSETTTFTAVAKGYGGEAADQVTVTVLKEKLAITAVVDGASFQPGPLVPRSYVTLYFECAEDCGDYAESGPEFVSKLGRISVLVDGTEAWVVFSGGRRVFGGVRQPNQVNFVLPGSLDGRDEAEVVLKLETASGTIFSEPFKVILAEKRINLFTYTAWVFPDERPHPDNIRPIAMVAKGIIGPANGRDFGQTQAIPGEVVTLWGNGCGRPKIPLADNEIARGDAFQTFYDVKVKIDGREAQVLWAGYAPGYPALCQINAVVPLEITGNGDKYLWLDDNTELHYWLAVKERQ